jgi:hypothetical protein
LAQVGPEPIIGAELAAFMARGVAVIVATRNHDLQPEITRGWGPHVSDGGRRLTLGVSVPAASATRHNLEANGEIAITFSLPTTYRSVQVKGRATLDGDPSPEQLSRMESHLGLFVEDVAQIGLPDRVASRLMTPPFAAVTCSVRELYDQTPGAGAGAPL